MLPTYNAGESKNAKWYVIRAVSGSESSIIGQIKSEAEKRKLSDYFADFYFPAIEKKVTTTTNKQSTRIRSALPGYILICMNMQDVTYNLVRTTQGVIEFLGIDSKNPKPIDEKNFTKMVQVVNHKQSLESIVSFKVGDQVEIQDGSLKGFRGSIVSIENKSGIANVGVTVFGKELEMQVKFNEIKQI